MNSKCTINGNCNLLMIIIYKLHISQYVHIQKLKKIMIMINDYFLKIPKIPYMKYMLILEKHKKNINE